MVGLSIGHDVTGHNHHFLTIIWSQMAQTNHIYISLLPAGVHSVQQPTLAAIPSKRSSELTKGSNDGVSEFNERFGGSLTDALKQHEADFVLGQSNPPTRTSHSPHTFLDIASVMELDTFLKVKHNKRPFHNFLTCTPLLKRFIWWDNCSMRLKLPP